MILIFAILAAVLSLGGALFGELGIHLLWQIPLTFIGSFLGFIILHELVFLIAILIVNTNSDNSKCSKFYRVHTETTLIILFKILNIHIHTSGLELVPENERFLLVSNHTYDFDPAVFMWAMPHSDLGFVGKKEIYTKMVFISKIMHKLNGLPIDRENNRNAIETINKAANFIKNDICSMAIFPEGYVSLTGELLPFRNGSFKIAKKAKCPIVVATLTDTRIILKNLFRRRTDIYMDVLTVIPTDEVEKLTTAELSEKIYPIIYDGMQANKEKLTNTAK